MRRAIVSALALLVGGFTASACSSNPNHHVQTAKRDAAGQPITLAGDQHEPRDNQAELYQGTIDVNPEQREYARLSRERLRAIELRAEELTHQRQAIPPSSQGNVAATLNLLPRKCDETEREIDAIEAMTSAKWLQRKGGVDRKLANLERSLDRAEDR